MRERKKLKKKHRVSQIERERKKLRDLRERERKRDEDVDSYTLRLSERNLETP